MFTYIKSILFVIVTLCITGYICKTYEKINDKLSLDAVSNSDMNPKIFYFITPIFLASIRAFLFKNANGPLMLHVKSLFYKLDKPDFSRM